MKHKNIVLLAGVGGAMLINSSSYADYVTLVLSLESSNQVTAAGPRDVYRVYAEFTDGADRVNAWYGESPGLGSMSIQNVLSNLTPGSGFTQFGGAGGNLAPYSPGTSRDWDTYATIGVRYGSEAPGGGDATLLSPGFPTFINGNSLNANQAAVFITADDPQGRADYRVTGNDTNLRVLLMQLTVNVGEHVMGTINLKGNNADGSNWTAGQQAFFVPGPSALALLGLAGVVGSRRRRG